MPARFVASLARRPASLLLFGCKARCHRPRRKRSPTRRLPTAYHALISAIVMLYTPMARAASYSLCKPGQPNGNAARIEAYVAQHASRRGLRGILATLGIGS